MKYFIWDIYDGYGVKYRVVFANSRLDAEAYLKEYLLNGHSKVTDTIEKEINKIIKDKFIEDGKITEGTVISLDYIE